MEKSSMYSLLYKLYHWTRRPARSMRCRAHVHFLERAPRPWDTSFTHPHFTPGPYGTQAVAQARSSKLRRAASLGSPTSRNRLRCDALCAPLHERRVYDQVFWEPVVPVAAAVIDKSTQAHERQRAVQHVLQYSVGACLQIVVLYAVVQDTTHICRVPCEHHLVVALFIIKAGAVVRVW